DHAHRPAASDQDGRIHLHHQKSAQNLSPVDLITSDHSARSAAINAANSSGVLLRGSAPYCSSRATNCGSFAARPISPAILLTMFFGVPAGAKSPFQVNTLNPGNPDSAIVGTSGICGARLSLDTASRRTEPLAACGIASEMFENMVCRCPATTSVKAGALPR